MLEIAVRSASDQKLVEEAAFVVGFVMAASSAGSSRQKAAPGSALQRGRPDLGRCGRDGGDARPDPDRGR